MSSAGTAAPGSSPHVLVSTGTGLAAQLREAGLAFGYARSDIPCRVKLPGFLPQPSGFFHLSRLGFENREGPNRVGEIERRCSLLAAIERERLQVTGLGSFGTACILMDVPQMPHRVCQCERVPFFATNGDGFLVQWLRRIVTPQVSLDLAEPLECLQQFASRASLTTERHSFDEIAMRIRQAMLSSRPIRASHECHGRG